MLKMDISHIDWDLAALKPCAWMLLDQDTCRLVEHCHIVVSINTDEQSQRIDGL